MSTDHKQPIENKKIQFEKNEKTFKSTLESFWKRMTTPGTSYAQRLQSMNPQERAQARELFRKRIKWGSYSFVALVMTGYALYSKYLGTEESRLRYNIREYLAKEEFEVQKLRLEVAELEKRHQNKFQSTD